MGQLHKTLRCSLLLRPAYSLYAYGPRTQPSNYWFQSQNTETRWTESGCEEGRETGPQTFRRHSRFSGMRLHMDLTKIHYIYARARLTETLRLEAPNSTPVLERKVFRTDCVGRFLTNETKRDKIVIANCTFFSSHTEAIQYLQVTQEFCTRLLELLYTSVYQSYNKIGYC